MISRQQLFVLVLFMIGCTTYVLANRKTFFRTMLGYPSIGKRFSRQYEKAAALARLEQDVEDYNALWVASAKSAAESTSRRRLICLPLNERFDPSMGNIAHEHVQTGDTMSLPRAFADAVKENGAEVPWLFTVRRVDGVTSDRLEVPEDLAAEQLDEVVGSVLDFRAPRNYIFLPWWMMRSLGLSPMDVVDVRITTTVPKGAEAKLRPHSSDFIKDISNTQAVLEMELRHYSSLTKGATIAFDFNDKRYWFDVVELRSAPKNKKEAMIKVQDCDVATNFIASKDTVKKKKAQLKEEEEDDGE